MGSKKKVKAAKTKTTSSKPVKKLMAKSKAVTKSKGKTSVKPKAKQAKAKPKSAPVGLKTPAAVAATFSVERPGYLPREGSLPDMIFRRLMGKPMPYGELARHLEADSKLTGDALTSQLSAALYDLCNKRGVLVRVDYDTLQPVPASRSRGALYTVADRARSGYEARQKLGQKRVGSGATAVVESGQRDLSSFVNGAGTHTHAHAQVEVSGSLSPKPEKMSDAMYVELRSARQAASDTIHQASEAIAAIDRLLKVPNFS
jgi:hypothetical protein